MRRLSVFMGIGALLLAAAASAQLHDIGEFSGVYSEGFETQQRYQFLPHYDVFGGAGDIWQIGSGQGLHITSGWGFYFTTYPHSGEVFMGPTWGIAAKWEFDVPAARFGGWFTTNYQSSGATAYFYDVNGALIGSKPVAAPAGNNAWKWDGWHSDVPVKYLEIYSDYGAGHIMQDDVQIDPIPEPVTLALAGLGFGALALRRRK